MYKKQELWPVETYCLDFVYNYAFNGPIFVFDFLLIALKCSWSSQHEKMFKCLLYVPYFCTNKPTYQISWRQFLVLTYKFFLLILSKKLKAIFLKRTKFLENYISMYVKSHQQKNKYSSLMCRSFCNL